MGIKEGSVVVTKGKTEYRDRISGLADELGIQKNTVRAVVGTYMTYCGEHLYGGHRLQFLGLVDIVPKPCVESEYETLALASYNVAQSIGVLENTSFVIIQAFLDSIRSDILRGKPAEIRGLVSFHPIIECMGGEVIGVHSSISVTIREDTKRGYDNFESVRVYTQQSLKYEINKRRKKDV